jgi:hypothetical protein
MIERPHGVEGVSGVAGTGPDTGAGGIQLRIGVADAHANIAPCRFRNYLQRSGKFRRNGHDAHLPVRGLPETFKDFECGLDEVFRGMHTAAFVTEEWTFQMDAERPSLRGIAIAGD